MRTPRTSAGLHVVATITDAAGEMARLADEPDTPTYLRSIYAAKRDTLRLLLVNVPKWVAEAEDEASRQDFAELERIEAALDTVTGAPV